MVRFGVPGQHLDTLSYADYRLNVVPAIQSPRRPTTTDKKFPLWCEWRTNKNAIAPVTEGEFWKLIKFESNGDATWVRYFASGVSAGVSDLRDQVNTQVTPDGSGFIDIDGFIVANASNPSGIPFETVADVGTNTLDLNMQLSTTLGANPANSNSVGVCCFDSAAFTIDNATGYVQLLGGGIPPALQFQIDSANPPGTNPTLPDGTGTVGIFGTCVPAQTIPLRTHSTVANAFDIEVQVASDRTGAPGNKNDAGVCSFDDVSFLVDGDGYVKLIGGVAAIGEIDVDDGANVVPTAGIVSIKAAAVANQDIPIQTKNNGVNAVLIEAQVSKAVAASPVTSAAAGVASFDSASFTVDTTTGFVQLIGGVEAIGEIDVDDGANVVPTSGVISIKAAAVANQDIPIQTKNNGANAVLIEAQISTTSALSDTTKNGLCHFKSTDFSVDANGFVSSTGGGGGGLFLIQTLTANSDTSLDFENVFSASYNNYLILGRNLQGTSGLRKMFAQFGTGVGPTWQATDYRNHDTSTTTAINLYGDTTGSLGLGSECFRMEVFNVLEANSWKGSIAQANISISSNGLFLRDEASRWQNIVLAVNSIRFFYSVGLMVTGTISVYGYDF